MSNNYSLRIGEFPTPLDVIPTTFTDTTLTIGTLVSSTLVSSIALNTTAGESILAGLATTIAVTLGRRIETAQKRRGCILKEGGITIREAWESSTRTGFIDTELTDIYKSALGDETAFVEKHQSEQYNIHVIYNEDPDAIRAKLTKIARKLGIKPEQLLYYPVWGKGASAILAHRDEAEWEANTVDFDESAVIKGRMILQAGRDVHGNTMTYNRVIYPHAGFYGETGAGKTEAMINDMVASRKTGLNPQIYIIDPKNTSQLKRQASEYYTNDVADGVELMLSIVARCEERINRYSEAKCDNYWQYIKKVDSEERPICLYIDELAEVVSPDVATDSKEAKELADKAKAIITRLVQKYRSAGLFVSIGMQHPLASVISTNIRNNLGIVIALSVKDHKAAGVAGVQGAENLPMQGGMIVKQGKKVSYGRGVYHAEVS